MFALEAKGEIIEEKGIRISPSVRENYILVYILCTEYSDP